MKNLNIFLLLFLSYTLSACGLHESMEAVKATPKKMDDMHDTMEKMNKGMDETVGGINDQRKLIPIIELMKYENYDELSPVPVKLMPYGEKLAQAVSADDMVKIAYLWLKEIDEIYPPKEVDQNGDEIEYTKEQVNKINTTKLGRLAALQIVTGFLPQVTVDQIIEEQIVKFGRFEETAYTILMLRAQFIRDVLLEASLLSMPLNSVGKLNQAIIYTRSLEFITQLPFVEQIKMKIKGLLSPMENFEEILKKDLALVKWKKIKLSAEKDLKIEKQVITGNSEKDAQIFKNKEEAFALAMKTIDEHISKLQ